MSKPLKTNLGVLAEQSIEEVVGTREADALVPSNSHHAALRSTTDDARHYVRVYGKLSI